MLRSNSARKRHLLVHSRDTRRLLFLTLLVSAAACVRAFSLFQSSFRAAHCHVSPSVHPARTQSATALFVAPQNPEPDEDEWRALLAAFQMYKAAYGDLKVPSRFIVPGMPPWPGKTLSRAMIVIPSSFTSFTHIYALPSHRKCVEHEIRSAGGSHSVHWKIRAK